MFMKITYVTFYFLLCVTSVVAQKNQGHNRIQNLSKLEIGFQGIGYGYETGLGNNLAIDFSGGLGGGYYVYENEVSHGWNLFQPALYFSVNPKLYYNRKRRFEKGHNTNFNSGNYFGLMMRFTTPALFPSNSTGDLVTFADSLRYSYLFNFHWGLQRPIGSKWLFNVHVGLGVARDLEFSYQSIYPALDLKFCYLFNHRKLNHK